MDSFPDFGPLADRGASPERLAQAFLSAYFPDREPVYPLNPFQMLRDMGVAFELRPFEGYEGVYLPAEGPDDIPVVGINLNRPITRQRYTAAHELCHHLKDSRRPIACEIGSQSPIERYAESFAAALLMPRGELTRLVKSQGNGGRVDFPGALRIADHFGVSFQACLYRLAYDLHVIDGDISAESLEKRRKEFGPNARKRELGITDVPLYEQLFDSADDYLSVRLTPRTRQLFETEYVFHDSRMEGVDISRTDASEIVVDLRFHGSKSPYCKSENGNIIEVAGLSCAYDYVFEKVDDGAPDVSIYDAKAINERLFSLAPHPEYSGGYRQSNTLVVGAKFETADARKIPQEMHFLDEDVQKLIGERIGTQLSKYIEGVLDVQHKMTVIHPFRDGNGRTSRAFTNLLFGIRGLPPVLFSGKDKNAYKAALAKADGGNPSDLYRVYFRGLLDSHALLTGG